MRTTGIIAEYNPFHNGHLYHMEEARRLSGADYIIVVMSPDFVQRGAPALLDKWTRARMALEAGADLVLELPVRSAVGSAEFFAHGAVSLLSSLGVVDAISFGCETDRIGALAQFAHFLCQEEPAPYRIALQQLLREGKSYAQARCMAYLRYRNTLSPHDSGRSSVSKDDPLEDNALAGILREPNNILAVEYLKALRKTGSSMQPCPVLRAGTGYHDLRLYPDTDQSAAQNPAFLSQAYSCAPAKDVCPAKGLVPSPGFASAAAIRTALLEGRDVRNQMPPAAYDLLREAFRENRYLTSVDLDLPLRLKLYECSGSLSAFLDISDDLANRMEHLLPLYTGFEQFAALLKTKQIAHTRVRRALLHILLDLKKEAGSHNTVPDPACTGQDPSVALPVPRYARVLGFRRSAQPLLSRIKSDASVPLLTKLPPRSQMSEALREDLKASHLWELLISHKTGCPIRMEQQRRIIIV